jgi:dienelactone hydrolase
MVSKYRKLIISLFLVFLFCTSIGLAKLFDSAAGRVKTESVTFDGPTGKISGWLYKPNPKNPPPLIEYPAVLLIHGVMNAKETMSAIALELARDGIVALTIDATGHGNSDGASEGVSDSSLGGDAALSYLKSLPYVADNRLGVVGHSMGVGAIRAASFNHGNISTHVFIGGLSASANTSIYGELSTLTPSNLLVAIGKYDELFNMNEVQTQLQPVFGTSEQIEINEVYGSFFNYTARKLITPSTIHLFEPISKIARQSVEWILSSFYIIQIKPPVLLFPFRDLFLFLAFCSFIGLVIPVYNSFTQLPKFLKKKEENENFQLDFSIWKIGLPWSFALLTMFVPAVLIFGFGDSFIPLDLGATAIFWMILLSVTGIIMLYTIFKSNQKESSFKEITKGILSYSSNWRNYLLALGIFIVLFGIVMLSELIPGMSLKMFVPLFSNFTGIRFLMFLILVPFMFIFFIFDGMITSGNYNRVRKGDSFKEKLGAFSKVTGIKVSIFVLVLLVQYIPLFAFNFRILTGFLGFSMQFIIMLVPLFISYTAITLFFYEKTGSIETSALLNALLLAWTLSTLLPIR